MDRIDIVFFHYCSITIIVLFYYHVVNKYIYWSTLYHQQRYDTKFLKILEQIYIELTI